MPAPSPPPDVSVPVVAVGASAGGMGAIAALLRSLGDAPNLSLIVLQHLSREHESALVSILQRSTSMPVEEAHDGALLEANHVYVAPPRAAVVVEQDRLKLVPRSLGGGLEHPIDRLFYSLAMERGALAVGVVLSGAGTDGSLGVRAIKLAGGITLAQDQSAEYGGMPSSAVASGCVDFVLPPEGIANQLARLARRLPAEHAFSIADDDFRRVVGALRLASGIDFGGFKEATIRRRLERRYALLRMPTLKDYLQLLEKDSGEAKILASEALIHVTSFFRDAAAFDSLKRNVLARLTEHPRQEGIRVWVPGCATGEEVYSIAICLLDMLHERGVSDIPIRIFGTDASEAAIQAARSACYSEGIERELSAEQLRRHFTHVAGVYRVRKELREVCVFARHDLTREPPFSHIDLISCRNLMIYLTTAAQDRLLPVFHYALNDPGFLFLGPAETARSHAGFAPIDQDHRIYQRAPGERRLPSFGPLGHMPDPTSPGTATAPRVSRGDLVKQADRIVIEKYAPCGVVVTDELEVLQFRGKTGRYLEPAPGAARFELLRMVREDLRIPLRKVLDEARSAGRARGTARAILNQEPALVEMEVIALDSDAGRHYVVLFRDAPAPPVALTPAVVDGTSSGRELELSAELASARQYLETVIEQLEEKNEELKAANEETTSSNEELRSTNEELQAAKEELQATNQELVTVNDEMLVRNQEATQLADDLTNVLNSVDVPVLLLDRECKIRRFTPAAAVLFGLDVGDVRRELASLKRPFADDCVEMALQVVHRLQPRSRTVRGPDGRWHLLQARPYLTLEHKIDGSIITAFDVDAVAGTTFRELLTGASEGMLMIEAGGHIVFSNHAAASLFGYAPDELLGVEVEQLVPHERRASHAEDRSRYLAAASPRTMARNREVLGRKRDGTTIPLEVTLNPARGQNGPLVIAFVRDITERRKTELEIQTYQSRLQHMAFDAALAEERERRRIAVSLHDRIGQGLALARIKLSAVRDAATGEAREAVNDAMLLLAQSLESTRTLTFDLSPPILYDLGLKAALSWLAEDLEQRFGLVVTLRMDESPTPLAEESAALVFRAVRELLINVLKHAQSSEAELAVASAGGALKISVQDRGVGFDPATPRSGNGGFGLLSVREQIARLGGSVEVVSALEQGTRITISVPLTG